MEYKIAINERGSNISLLLPWSVPAMYCAGRFLVDEIDDPTSPLNRPLPIPISSYGW